MEPVFRVLFVCTGNTCRSPLAEAALAAELGPNSGVQVSSAGVAAADGEAASTQSVLVAARDGIELAGHRSRRLTRELLASADLVLAMERSHVSAARALGADPERIHLLSEWPPPGVPELELSDPFGGSSEAYEECWRRIRLHVARIAPHILEAQRSQSR